MSKKKQKKLIKKIKGFLKSYNAIIAALVLIIIILLMLSYHLMNSSKTYMFNGTSDNVRIFNGIISLNYDVNLFQGSDIEYIAEEDYKIVDYKMGYYIENNNKLIPLAVKTGSDEEGLSLKAVVNEISAFNVTEPYHNKAFFTKDKIKALDENIIYFIIEAKTDDGEEILEKLEITLTKVSK